MQTHLEYEMPMSNDKDSFVPSAIIDGEVHIVQPAGFSLWRNSVLRAFMAPAPVPSAVIDHTLMYGLM